MNTIIEGVCEGTVSSGGYNIESPNDTCSFTGTGDQHTVLPGDLNLGLLQDNGGPTLTRAPQVPSAAINQILLGACALTTDQRGEDRPKTGGSMCDVGAVEVQ